MHFHVRLHHWVVGWIYVGIACGVAALANIVLRALTHRQEVIILVIGALYWAMGGLLCWAWEGVRIQRASRLRKTQRVEREGSAKTEHLSSFLAVPGRRTRP